MFVIDPWIMLNRGASKKSGGSTQNAGKARPKHRGIKYQDGQVVQKGTMLVTQNFLRFHPGMNVSCYLYEFIVFIEFII